MLGLLCVSIPRGGYADSSVISEHKLQLVSDDQPQPSTEAEGRNPAAKEPEKARSRDLPSLADLGLNLDSSELVKRNELDSLSLQPWTPGRGAVGVKVEVTW